ncbi:MAG: nucleotidyltransferase family protein [Acidobacteriaceae bacterium]|nr:nucleotidyltransferase family protein [Acidobacteriaceae bacterium]
MSVAAILLAAGFSRRLGRDKQRVQLHGEMLVERAVRIAVEAGLEPVVAVVREADLIAPLQALGALVVLNRKALEGMATSIHAGLRTLPAAGVEGAVLMTCDQVMLTAAHLQSLSRVRDQITGSRYAKRIGVPAYFPAATFGSLSQLQGDEGARSLLREAAAVVNEDLALDIDTEDDLLRARTLLEAESRS